LFKVELSHPSLTNDLWNDLQPLSETFALLKGVVKGFFILDQKKKKILGKFGNGELKIIVKFGNRAF